MHSSMKGFSSSSAAASLGRLACMFALLSSVVYSLVSHALRNQGVSVRSNYKRGLHYDSNFVFKLYYGNNNGNDAASIDTATIATSIVGNDIKKITANGNGNSNGNMYGSAGGKYSSSSAVTSVQKDYLGMINFCLRSSDTALSAPSRSKVLNELTNEVFRVLLIGNSDVIEDLLLRFDWYRKQADKTPCTLRGDDSALDEAFKGDDTNSAAYEQACEEDLLKAQLYIDKLEALVCRSEVADGMQGGIYDRGYKRMLTSLKDAGCKFGSIAAKPVEKAVLVSPVPVDTNICLSLIDLRLPAATKTKTRELNKISNCVSRAMRYGSRKEKGLLADSLESSTQAYVDKWCGGAKYCQEELYLRALCLLLRDNIEIAELSVLYYQNNKNNAEFGYSNISNFVSDFVADTSNTYGSSIVLLQNGKERTVPYLRLQDVYLNAFQRVVEACVTDLRSGESSYIPQNEDLLLSFVNWEQNLRRNLTASAWIRNPSELVGRWELVDVASEGSLGSLISGDREAVDRRKNVEVVFFKDGKVELQSPAVSGVNWSFSPGPAHLDTCEFNVVSKIKSDLTLKYVGFIDRGQRIESRVSRSPVRMTGRVVSIINGEIRGSSRFVMSLASPQDGAM